MTHTDCPNCSELAEQVAYWKHEAIGTGNKRNEDRLQSTYGVSRGEAWIIQRLYSTTGGRYLSNLLLGENLPGRKPDRDDPRNLAIVLVCRIRKRFGGAAIETQRDQGYRLSADFRMILDNLFEGEDL